MLFFFAPEVIRLISTEAFTTTHIYGMSAVQALQVVSWIFLCYFIASLSNYILIARGEQKKILYINTFIALINIIGNILVIPHFSFLGAAWITLITQILLVSITWWMVRDIYEQKQFLFAGVFLLITGVLSGYISTWVIGIYLPPDSIHLLQILGRSLLGGIIFGICYLSAWYLMYRYI